MPETQTPPPPFGQIVAVAQRALSAALDGLLGEAGTTFQRWAALNMLAARGSAPLDALRREVAEALQADERSIAELFDQLESDGLIQTAGDRGAPDGTRIELTAGGETPTGGPTRSPQPRCCRRSAARSRSITGR